MPGHSAVRRGLRVAAGGFRALRFAAGAAAALLARFAFTALAFALAGAASAGLGQDALLDFQMEVTLDGEALTAAEIRDLLAKSDGLALVRGKWVELDHEHALQPTLPVTRGRGGRFPRQAAGVRTTTPAVSSLGTSRSNCTASRGVHRSG